MGLLLFVVMMTAIGWPEVSVAQQVRKPEGAPKVSPGVWKKVNDAGTVRVIVNLHVPGWTSKKLSQEDQLKQQAMVADVQDEVLRELAGTRTGPAAAVVEPNTLMLLSSSQKSRAKFDRFFESRKLWYPR